MMPKLRGFAPSRETVLSARPALLPPPESPPGKPARPDERLSNSGWPGPRAADTGKGSHSRATAGRGFR
ncbi:MAG: hypothetical protein NTU95_12145 [Methanothrix sp.]|nr:hypothetical protein [Methanothrix sp.]